MSQYAEQKTAYKDRDCLVAALAEMGYKDVEIHEEAQQLFDYHGRATTYLDAKGDKANVIVRRKYVGGAANDLGFVKKADGTYSAIISQYDTGKHNTTWLEGLKKNYAEKRHIKTAKQQGFAYLGRKVINGKTQLQFLDRRA
jgi:hypothetical protein